METFFWGDFYLLVCWIKKTEQFFLKQIFFALTIIGFHIISYFVYRCFIIMTVFEFSTYYPLPRSGQVMS